MAYQSDDGMPPGQPSGHGGRPPQGGGGGGNPQLAALLATQSEILRQIAQGMDGAPPHGPPPHGQGQGPHGPPSGRPRPPPPRLPAGGTEHPHHHRHHRPPPRDGGPPPGGPPPHGPPQGGPPGPPPDGGNAISNIANTLSDVANAAASIAQGAPQVSASLHFGTGDDGVAVVNPVWSTLAQVLSEMITTVRESGVSPDEEVLLRVVGHLRDVVMGLAANPNDTALLAEYKELSEFLAAHPDSHALSQYIATHPAIAPAIASVAPSSTGWAGSHPYDWHYPPLYAEAPVYFPIYAAGQQLDIVGPSIHRYRASGGLDIVGPSIHRYRASGFDLGGIVKTLGDVATAAAHTVPQISAAFSGTGVGYYPPGGASTGWAGPLLGGFALGIGGFALGSAAGAWLNKYVSHASKEAVQQAKTATAVTGADALPVNPVWATLAKVLSEVVTGFRVTGVRPEQEGFLRVVDHLSQVASGLALTPNDPALLTEYQELSEFLAAHPDSHALSDFIGTHPAIVPAIAPVLAAQAAAAPAALPAHAAGWATGALPSDAFHHQTQAAPQYR